MKYLIKAEEILMAFRLSNFKIPSAKLLDNDFDDADILRNIPEVNKAIRNKFLNVNEVSLYRLYFDRDGETSTNIDSLLSNLFHDFVGNQMKYVKDVILKCFTTDDKEWLITSIQGLKIIYTYTIRKDYIIVLYKVGLSIMQIALVIKHSNYQGLLFNPKDIEIDIDTKDILDTPESRELLLEQF